MRYEVIADVANGDIRWAEVRETAEEWSVYNAAHLTRKQVDEACVEYARKRNLV